MSVQTQVIWVVPSNPGTVAALDVKAQELTAQGKEIGNAVITVTGNQAIIDRFWIDTAAAEEWLAIVLPYNPVSAAIIP